MKCGNIKSSQFPHVSLCNNVNITHSHNWACLALNNHAQLHFETSDLDLEMSEPDAAGTGWAAFLPTLHSFLIYFRIYLSCAITWLQVLCLNVNFIILTGQLTETNCQIVQWHIQAKCIIYIYIYKCTYDWIFLIAPLVSYWYVMWNLWHRQTVCTVCLCIL